MKRRTFRRYSGVVGALSMVLTIVLIFAVVFAPRAVTAWRADRSLPVYCVERDDKCISLTFDAAWGNEDTQQLIDILTSRGVKATFFVVGDWVDKYPESVKALHDAGMEVMSHSLDHAHFNSLTSQQIRDNLNAANDKIEAVTGVRPTLFRCPYGEYNNNVIETVNSMGMTAIQWDVDSLDWKELSASEIYDRVTPRVEAGSIVLFHNAALHTPEALGDIIDCLQGKGYNMVKVSELLLTGETNLDSAGKQHPAS